MAAYFLTWCSLHDVYEVWSYASDYMASIGSPFGVTHG